MRIATSRGPRLVVLLRRKERNDDWYLQLSAPIATTRSPDPVDLLEWNGRSAAGALVTGGGELFYSRAHPLEWFDLLRIDTTRNDVATTSASLEMMVAEHGRISGSH